MLRKFIAFSLLLAIAISCTKEDVIDYGPIDQQIIEDYLKANELTAQSTSSGLYYIIEKPGSENHPNIKSKVSVNYKGYIPDGTVFDQSYSTGKPTDFALSGVIAGWQEGLQLIGAGGKIQLFIPSSLGYGANPPTGSVIPANSVLIFETELVDFY
jgi:FKBP-type peptidyl-prolyl cis-trans isomerase FkpA